MNTYDWFIMSEIKTFILKNVSNNPKNIVALTMKRFELSRPAVYRHMKALVASQDLVQTGSKSGSLYSLPHHQVFSWTIQPKGNESEDEFWTDNLRPQLKDLHKDVYGILYYCFTEMLNNAFDHSDAKEISIFLRIDSKKISIAVQDDGVGIFDKIKNFIGLDDIRDAIMELTKGKLTTAPKNHSGQGIFFTSRAVSEFNVQSGGYEFFAINRFEDCAIKSEKTTLKIGTKVLFEIEKSISYTIRDVFEKYSLTEDFDFDVTDIKIQLLSLMETELISRSQAKRLVFGLEKFDKLILDFKKVRIVGQGFCDEVFRVFQNQYPKIQIECIHLNDDIEFMIKRSIVKTSL